MWAFLWGVKTDWQETCVITYGLQDIAMTSMRESCLSVIQTYDSGLRGIDRLFLISITIQGDSL